MTGRDADYHLLYYHTSTSRAPSTSRASAHLIHCSSILVPFILNLLSLNHVKLYSIRSQSLPRTVIKSRVARIDFKATFSRFCLLLQI